MKLGIYSYPDFEGAKALFQGLKKHGYMPVLLSASDYDGTIESDFVFSWGLQNKGELICNDHKKANIPVIIIDYGYIKRTNNIHEFKTGHWQVGFGGLNVICNDDSPERFDNLNIEIIEQGNNPDGHVLICAQTAGDKSHSLDEKGIKEWLNLEKSKHQKVLLRPHPLEANKTYGMMICKKPLQDSLKSCQKVVTLNSNVGHEALLQGVPVEARMKAAYQEMTGNLPTLEKRRKYFNRVANSQWTWSEMESGLAVDYWKQSKMLP